MNEFMDAQGSLAARRVLVVYENHLLVVHVEGSCRETQQSAEKFNLGLDHCISRAENEGC